MTVNLRELKGAPISVLMALFMLGEPASQTQLVDETGYKDRPVSDALRMLSAPNRNYVMAIPGGRHPRWALTGRARQLPLGWAALDRKVSRDLSDSELPLLAGLEVSRDLSDSDFDPDSNAIPAVSSCPKLSRLNLDSAPQRERELIKDSISGEELERQFAEVLAAGGVWLNIRRALAADLAAEHPDFLAHLLGHLARAKSGRAEHYREPAVYLKHAAEGLDYLSEGDLPPADLDFAAGLAWAKAGGQTEAQLEAARAALALADAAADLAAEPQLPAPAPTELDVLWHAVLDQMARELPAVTFETWLRPTRLAGRQGDAFRVAAPNALARDWLANRLTTPVKRTLKALAGAGEGITVTFIAD